MWLYILAGVPTLIYVLWKVWMAHNNGNNDYWPSRGVPTVLAHEIKDGWKMWLGLKPLHNVDLIVYSRYPDAPYVGAMEFRRPYLYVKDPELVKKITVKDFDHFVNRRSFHFGGEFSDTFLFNMAGTQWKDMRARMTPTFTSGKMRRMFDLFDKSSKDLADYVEKKGEKGATANEAIIETREFFGRFTMDVIGSTAFGIDSQCLKDKESIFYKMGKLLQRVDLIRGFKFFLIILMPKFAKLIGVDMFPKKPTNFFSTIIARALAARRENYSQNKKKGQSQPSDFLQLMVEAQKDELKDDNEEEGDQDGLADFERDAKITSGKNAQITDTFIVGNAFTFFIAGFDNTEAILSVAAYHLAVYPEMQARLSAEVEEVTNEFSGQITYDSVAKMSYLDMFISECLRLYPPGTRYEREATKPYTIPATGSTPELTIPVGTLCVFSVLAFHQDPKHYPNPEKFDPERFNKENKASRHPYAYMPFGLGPRSCIAMRFVLTEVKAAVAHLVHNFEIRTCAATTIPLKLQELQGQYRPASGLKLALVKRR